MSKSARKPQSRTAYDSKPPKRKILAQSWNRSQEDDFIRMEIEEAAGSYVDYSEPATPFSAGVEA